MFFNFHVIQIFYYPYGTSATPAPNAAALVNNYIIYRLNIYVVKWISTMQQNDNYIPYIIYYNIEKL